MKRCPTWQRSFDDSLTYCLDDGTPLVVESARPDSEQTLVSPSEQTLVSQSSPQSSGAGGGSRELPPTQYAQLPGKPTVNVSQFQTPPSSPYGAPQRRRVWPWVVAALAAMFFLVLVIAM